MDASTNVSPGGVGAPDDLPDRVIVPSAFDAYPNATSRSWGRGPRRANRGRGCRLPRGCRRSARPARDPRRSPPGRHVRLVVERGDDELVPGREGRGDRPAQVNVSVVMLAPNLTSSGEAARGRPPAGMGGRRERVGRLARDEGPPLFASSSGSSRRPRRSRAPGLRAPGRRERRRAAVLLRRKAGNWARIASTSKGGMRAPVWGGIVARP